MTAMQKQNALICWVQNGFGGVIKRTSLVSQDCSKNQTRFCSNQQVKEGNQGHRHYHGSEQLTPTSTLRETSIMITETVQEFSGFEPCSSSLALTSLIMNHSITCMCYEAPSYDLYNCKLTLSSQLQRTSPINFLVTN